MKKIALLLRRLFAMATIVSLLVMNAAGAVDQSRVEKETYFVRVNIRSCTLILFRKLGGTGLAPIKEYRVGTAVRGLAVYPTGTGKVTRIEINPWWHPTQYTREIFRKLRNVDLPEAVPPGDPANYMGSFKIHLSHATERGKIYRIHGNNNPARVGKRVTGGCICMDNDEGLELAKTISEGTEVEIVM